jgi:hypothetical protein
MHFDPRDVERLLKVVTAICVSLFHTNAGAQNFEMREQMQRPCAKPYTESIKSFAPGVWQGQIKGFARGKPVAAVFLPCYREHFRGLNV